MFKFLLANPIYRSRVDLAALLLRIAGGGFMLSHGYGKLEKIMAGNVQFGDPIGLGPEVSIILVVFAEVLCALFLLFGIFTRLASIPLAFTMAVAAFIVHAEDGFGKQEMSLLYLTIFIVLLILGGGKYSLQSLMSKRK